MQIILEDKININLQKAKQKQELNKIVFWKFLQPNEAQAKVIAQKIEEEQNEVIIQNHYKKLTALSIDCKVNVLYNALKDARFSLKQKECLPTIVRDIVFVEHVEGVMFDKEEFNSLVSNLYRLRQSDEYPKGYNSTIHKAIILLNKRAKMAKITAKNMQNLSL